MDEEVKKKKAILEENENKVRNLLKGADLSAMDALRMVCQANIILSKVLSKFDDNFDLVKETCDIVGCPEIEARMFHLLIFNISRSFFENSK